jgi:acyl-CoA reductase-like NAD-dependent aldehyde dehydrogenase
MSPSSSAGPWPLYVGGDWIATEEYGEIRLPYDESVAGKVHLASVGLARHAVQAARAAARDMRALSNFERSDLLFRVHAVLKERVAEIGLAICMETGKPVKEARIEAGRGLETLLDSAIEARLLRGEAIPIDGAPSGKGRMAMTIREPRGVIAAITPFNVPFNLAMHKVAPALAAGNAVVHKPAEQTPLSALLLASAIEQAGAPKGAYNVIWGDGASLGAALIADSDVAMITFTGSVRVGKSIRAAAGLKKVTLELGGNSAVVIEPDADLDVAAARTVTGGFSHSGQVCISVQRIFVHDDIAGAFLARFAEAVSKLKIGHPLDEESDISSLISEAAAVRVAEWIDEARAGGAKQHLGGARSHATIPPTILENVPNDCRLSCQEVFGPVVALYRYHSLDEAIRRVNETPYGLQAGIFTRDLERGFYAARQFEMGGVMINDIPMFRADNMPYGGVKESGNSREGPRYAMEEMTEPKLICWKI